RHFKEDVVEESGTVESAGDQVAQQEKAEQIIKEDKELHDEVIASPVSGKAESLKDVNDPVFSTEAMGKGAAMVPSEGTIYSPVTGRSEEHTSELQSRFDIVCRLLLENKNIYEPLWLFIFLHCSRHDVKVYKML